MIRSVVLSKSRVMGDRQLETIFMLRDSNALLSWLSTHPEFDVNEPAWTEDEAEGSSSFCFIGNKGRVNSSSTLMSSIEVARRLGASGLRTCLLQWDTQRQQLGKQVPHVQLATSTPPEIYFPHRRGSDQSGNDRAPLFEPSRSRDESTPVAVVPGHATRKATTSSIGTARMLRAKLQKEITSIRSAIKQRQLGRFNRLAKGLKELDIRRSAILGRIEEDTAIMQASLAATKSAIQPERDAAQASGNSMLAQVVTGVCGRGPSAAEAEAEPDSPHDPDAATTLIEGISSRPDGESSADVNALRRLLNQPHSKLAWDALRQEHGHERSHEHEHEDVTQSSSHRANLKSESLEPLDSRHSSMRHGGRKSGDPSTTLQVVQSGEGNEAISLASRDLIVALSSQLVAAIEAFRPLTQSDLPSATKAGGDSIGAWVPKSGGIQESLPRDRRLDIDARHTTQPSHRVRFLVDAGAKAARVSVSGAMTEHVSPAATLLMAGRDEGTDIDLRAAANGSRPQPSFSSIGMLPRQQSSSPDPLPLILGRDGIQIHAGAGHRDVRAGEGQDVDVAVSEALGTSSAQLGVDRHHLRRGLGFVKASMPVRVRIDLPTSKQRDRNFSQADGWRGVQVPPHVRAHHFQAPAMD